jgi:hypothetical protein
MDQKSFSDSGFDGDRAADNGLAVEQESTPADLDIEGIAVLTKPARTVEILTIVRHGSSYA